MKTLVQEEKQTASKKPSFLNAPRFIDLFAGIGGFRIALQSFGGQCVFTSEWDKYAQLTYEKNFGDKPAGDITQIPADAIPKHHVLCAGFPCQAFSVSGKQLGFNDTRGTLFFDVARIVKHHQPEVVFLENVKNFARHDEGRTLSTVEKTLSQLGYTVFHSVLNASEYGAPTSRKRIYILAFRKDLNVSSFQFPQPTLKSVALKAYLEKEKDFSKYAINRKDIQLKPTPALGKTDNALKPIRLGILNLGGQGERIYSPDGHAITLSAYGGGAASKTGAYLIDGQVRKLTPRECANVMGFPKSFQIPVNDQQAYKQFGNSVVIPVLKTIWSEVLRTLS